MTRGRRLVVWTISGAAVLLAVCAGSLVVADDMARRFTAFDLTHVPVVGPSYAAPVTMPAGWRSYGTRRSSITVPPMFTRRQSVSSAPTALVLTAPRHTAWISVTARPLPSGWWPRWYRWCLYAHRNPLALIGKALLVPPTGTRRPHLEEEVLGPWHAYLYVAPRRLVAELFDRSHQVTVVMAWRSDDVLDLETVRTILASVRVGQGGR